jgi:hypothetical protein
MMYTHRLHALIAAAAAAVLSAACASKSGKVTEESAGSVAASSSTALSGALAPASALIGGLTKSIPGLTQAQAIVGAGSVFALAKAKMPSDQFSQLGTAVPGTQALVDEALKAGLPALEHLAGPGSLTPTLARAGITPEMANQLVPTLTKTVSASGGQALADAFAAAVK